MKAIFVGSFNPFTQAHKDIVTLACQVFPSVVVAVAEDTGRVTVCDFATRIAIAKQSLQEMAGVEVMGFKGLLTDFLKNQKTDFLIRGLRNEADFSAEQALMQVYKSQYAHIKPIYFITQNRHISASVVRELARLGGTIEGYVAHAAKDLIVTTYGGGK